ncbi:pilus assembly protein PilM [Candidatus Dependentiae bacterium]|nr:pilus assembly protein PilM [Candidatus Dependentiae bacterium]MCC7415142.1 pilus assembly protein PilM [Campylobacterota bacterium]
MIRDLFFPEQLGGYYFFNKRIVGFDIGKTHITATQILLKGRSVIIEKTITEKIDLNNGVDFLENVGNALKKIVQQCDAPYEIRTAFASSTAIFKELRLPFISRQQIAMTIDFEVEPLLPFSRDDAIVDFIITAENLSEKSSDILVVAVQKQHIAQQMELFQAAAIAPDAMCVDVFSLYSFYAKSIGYNTQPGAVVLVDMGSHTTTLLYVLDGKLRLIRSLAKGSIQLIKSVSETMQLPLHQVMEMIIRYGLEKDGDPVYHKALTQALELFWREVAFTIQSFVVQTESVDRACHLLLFGGGSYLKGLAPWVTKLLKKQTTLWDIDLAIHDCGIQIESKTAVSRGMIMSLSAALPLLPGADCSLLKKEFTSSGQATAFKKQFLTSCALVCLIFGSLITETILQVSSLHTEIAASDLEARSELKDVSTGLLSAERFNDQANLDDLVEEEEALVKNEEKLWFSFANPARSSFLKYLLELTSKIDKKGLGFTINKLTIADGMITLDAQVKDRDALRILQKELQQSKLFIAVERQEDPTFKAMKIKLANAE